MMTTDPATKIESVIRNAVTQTIQFNLREGKPDSSFRPRMDIKDANREYVAYIDLPGVDEDELRFSWDKGALCIAGCRDFNHDGEDAEEFVQIQRIFGELQCRIPLSDGIDVAKATAKYKRGVLTIRIPKR